MLAPVTTRSGATAYLEDAVMEPDICGLDRLRLVEAPLAPEVRLHLAEDAIVWWARMEAQTGRVLTAPFWATAWPGGQALARYILDHPGTVAGRRVGRRGVGGQSSRRVASSGRRRSQDINQPRQAVVSCVSPNP